MPEILVKWHTHTVHTLKHDSIRNRSDYFLIHLMAEMLIRHKSESTIVFIFYSHSNSNNTNLKMETSHNWRQNRTH